MAIGLHNLKLAPGARKKRKRVGRGNASGHGTYSGRGLKGQKARSGGKSRLKFRGFRKQLQQTPKVHGFKSHRPKMEIVNLRTLELKFQSGEAIDAEKLAAKNLVKDAKSVIKILGEGKLTKKLTVRANAFSESARRGIMEAGGTAEIV